MKTTGGAERLWHRLKDQYWGVSSTDCVDYVKNSETHQIHQMLKKMITTRPIMLGEPGVMASVDLIDREKYSRQNDGYEWILTYIDLFSKWVDARPLKDTSKEGKMMPSTASCASRKFGSVLASFRVHVLRRQIRKLEQKAHKTDEDKALLARKIALRDSIGTEDIDCGELVSSNPRVKSWKSCVVAFDTFSPQHTIQTHRHQLRDGTEH